MKALIIEDDPNQQEFIRKGLLAKGFTCECCLDGEDGYCKLAADSYDVAVIDKMLPGMDGLEIVRRIRKQLKNPPVLIMQSQLGLPANKIAGLNLGADDYIAKPYSVDELIARINACQRRRIPIDADAIITFEDITCNTLARTVVRDGHVIELQPLEYDLFEYLLRNQGRFLADQLILEQVWDQSSSMCKRAIEVRVSSLRTKLGKFGGRNVIFRQKGRGYGIR